MTVVVDHRIAGAVHTAEKVLSMRAGTAVTLAEPEDLGGSGRTHVVRVRVAQNPLSMDRSLVIKALPDDEPMDAFNRELVSYKYATALPSDSRPGPQLVAYDSDERTIVLSDLGHGRAMADLLHSPEQTDIDRAISAWGQALGRMHAATVGGEHDFAALLRWSNGGRAVDGLWEQAKSAAEVADTVLTDQFGLPPVPGVLEVLDEGCSLFVEGDHRAFSPSDVGPENIMINDSGVQFLDYEWGGFRDATLDIAYAVVTFGPHLASQWADRTPALETAMVDAWRSEVQAIWPSLGHDRELRRKVFAARAMWVWLSTVWMLPVDVNRDEQQHGLALFASDPHVIVQRWRDLSRAAQGLHDGWAAYAAEVADALDASWLS
ncbi:hypothetical protein [Williamsia sterculiae]|uniref:Phosphotransferase enzyme family protein n=1 Tax=Williamsia sterculiae TaxID=1344003 RepID=A0A1N7EHA3_9NOCA|nr:hypothetical protein [Williamsia sterculiae]SIR87456.1 hypothetical protein SAMN05445060_1314 [Williamsia sterculiae]